MLPENSLVNHLSQIHDPRRQTKNLLHPLVNVLTIGLCGIICGCETFTEMSEFGNAKKEFFARFLSLKNGIPSHDTFGRLFALIPAETVMRVLAEWRILREITSDDHKRTSDVPETAIHIDGKTMRGTGRGQALVHLVGAWASEYGLALGQVAVNEKSNEIEAIPHLLDLLDIKNTVITIDAIGTQKEIARKIRDKEADYILALKKNHPTLYREVQEVFIEATDSHSSELKHIRRRENSHGREEIRDYYMMPVPEDLYQRKEWSDLKGLGMVIRTWKDKKSGKEHRAIRYYLLSCLLGVKLFARHVRSHWSIENGLHWVLDVAFREDECQISNPTAAANLSAMNRLALSVLKSDTTIKRGVKTKRKVAGWKEDYLLKMLNKITEL